MHKIAIFSDVHGNITALEAVQKDMVEQNVDEAWFLGDLFSPGPGGDDLVNTMNKINPSIMIRGNWDDLFIHGARGENSLSSSSKVYITKLQQANYERLTDKSIVAKLEALPIKKIVKVDNTTILLTHNMPNLNFGQHLYPTNDTTNFDDLVADIDVDLAIYAHVHHPLMRYTSAEQLVFNPGSVGQPFFSWDRLQTDLRAEYMILKIDKYGFAGVDFRKVDYDHNLEFQRAKKVDLPYLDLYAEQLKTGKIHTHDHDFMARINDERGYLQDVLNYNEKCKKNVKNIFL